MAEPHAQLLMAHRDVPMRPALHMHIGRQIRERPVGCKVPTLPLRHQVRINCLSISFMFFPVQFRSSDCVERMYVDPFNGLVQLAYRKGAVYEYSHVSRKAIINLLMNPNMSLGLWVNDNLLSYNSKSAIYGDCITLRCLDSKNLPIAA